MPFSYEEMNILMATYQPSTVDAYNNMAYRYWQRSLLHRAQSAIVIEGLPETWSNEIRDFLFYCLWRFGYVLVWDHDVYGLTFQPCTLTGQTWYYQPAGALVANPADTSEKFEYPLDDEHILMRLTPDYCGTWDVISYYAEKLAQMDAAINVSIINNKTPRYLAAKTKAAAETLKAGLDMVNKGNPAVVFDKRLIVSDDPITKDSPFRPIDLGKIEYLTSDQLRDFQTILNDFDSEIGIPTVPYQKAERMVTTEANSRAMDGVARATRWVECLEDSFKLINPAFGLQMSAKVRFDLQTEAVVTNGEEYDEDGQS